MRLRMNFIRLQVDGKRIAVRRRMGRRNERDSAGTDSGLPWQQQGGYHGSEYGSQAGAYPPPHRATSPSSAN